MAQNIMNKKLKIIAYSKKIGLPSDQRVLKKPQVKMTNKYL